MELGFYKTNEKSSIYSSAKSNPPSPKGWFTRNVYISIYFTRIVTLGMNTAATDSILESTDVKVHLY